jgi:multiple sugar transport system permease protein
MTRRKVINKILFYIGVIILIIPPIFVFAWMILTALKSGVQNIEYPPLFIFKPTMENFKAVFQQHNFFQYLINSTIIAFSATIISLLVGLPAAYSIVRYNQKKLSMAILIARMTPFISYLLPWYIVFRMLGLIDTFIGMIMTHLIIT